MNRVRAKKSLGQHFLKDRAIAQKIAATISAEGVNAVLEVGPGMGILTSCLLERNFPGFSVVEIDSESVAYLRENFPSSLKIIEGDFLALPSGMLFTEKMAVIGNFPYNISSQILFRILAERDKVTEVAGMFQREVAERICSGPGSKVYGILSVLLQAFYSVEYLFTVSENSFMPPPKVKSAVIRLKRNATQRLDCDEDLFFRVVKASFNQRRKTLRNSVRSAFRLRNDNFSLFHLRPEQLSVEQFVEMTRWIAENSE